MKSRAEKLQELLDNYAGNEKETIDRIISLFKECVPEEKSVEQCYCIPWENCGCVVDDFNKCRTETLKNIEEMGK